MGDPGQRFITEKISLRRLSFLNIAQLCTNWKRDKTLQALLSDYDVVSSEYLEEFP